ncbi:class I SAM-dependent methyltransferase [Nitrincola sp.]|uniref:class I SAM-dependent methyltransferase n=1 Tax=Nitrincola sp. TaxID=1926584 RepID=UPI003A932A64
MKTDHIRTFTQANKAAWDASAHLHSQGKEWDELLLAASQPDFNVLDDCLSATLTELGIAGRSAVQLGCNNARELLSLASFGARPLLGLDQSAAFLTQGTQLAAASGLSPCLVEADIYALPDDLGRYDLVLITIGVLNWMPDLPRFFQVVRGLMNPGALLVIYETHPILEVFNPDSANPFVVENSYFDKTPVRIEEAITYDGSDGGAGETGYWFVHTLGEIVTACVQSGLGVQCLQEHPHLNREVEYAIYENQTAQIPLCYTLVAEAPSVLNIKE